LVAKPACFLGAAWRVVLRIKIKNDGLALVVGERMLLAVVDFEAKGRRFSAMQEADFNRNLDELGYSLTLTPRQKAT
jgi:hypothetical protein